MFLQILATKQRPILTLVNMLKFDEISIKEGKLMLERLTADYDVINKFKGDFW